MKQSKHRLRPLGAGMQDTYTRGELLALCKSVLFTRARRMDTTLLSEALHALDERPDAEAAPHQSLVWTKIIARIQTPVRVPGRRLALTLALIVLLLTLVGVGLAWVFHLGVLTFPSASLRQYPSVETEAAQALVQTDLYTARYEHCELRVREAAFDGHQMILVYSLRDTRDGAVLTEDDRVLSSIAAAQLDGIGCCDYLTVDGQDVYLEDTFQLPGEEPAEMLYYLSATLPEEMQVSEVITVQMPIGELDLQTRTRLHSDVRFTMATAQAAQTALSADPVTAQWDTLVVEVVRADFSPLHGLVEVAYHAADADQPCVPLELRLFTPDGSPVGQARPSAYASKNGLDIDAIITQYIPAGTWPEPMVLAATLADGSMDFDHVLPLAWKAE